MHHIYRKAKKFKLEYDEEEGYYVADEFTGNAKVKLPSWKRANRMYDGSSKTNALRNPVFRYIESRVGDKWDDVYSDICRKANNEKAHIHKFILDRVEGSIHKDVQMIDGKPYYQSYWRYLKGLHKLSGEMYVHPTTGLLCRADSWVKEYNKAFKHKWLEDNFGKMHKVVDIKISDDVEFHLVEKQFKNYVQHIWMKAKKYKKYLVWQLARGSKQSVYYQYRSASKADIRKYNLNKTEGENNEN